MDRNLTLEAVRLTESASLFASRYMGKGDEELAFSAAAEAMVQVFDSIQIDGEIVIGPISERSELTAGTKVGCPPGTEVDIAVKPLDGKMTCARGGHNAISIVAMGEKGCFPKIPAGYMQKIAVGKEASGVVDINQTPDINIKRVARSIGKYIEDITVCVLDREVNRPLVDAIRRTGARIKFIRDGDVSGAISAAMNDNPIDILMGVGGAIESLLAAAALKCLGGDLQARLVPYDTSGNSVDDKEIMENIDKIYTIDDLVSGDDVLVSLTGVTDGVLMSGVRYISGGALTNSVVLRQKTHTLRFINAVHHFDFKPVF